MAKQGIFSRIRRGGSKLPATPEDTPVSDSAAALSAVGAVGEKRLSKTDLLQQYRTGDGKKLDRKRMADLIEKRHTADHWGILKDKLDDGASHDNRTVISSATTVAEVSEKLAETRERYETELRQLRIERTTWRADKRELQRLRQQVERGISSTTLESNSANVLESGGDSNSAADANVKVPQHEQLLKAKTLEIQVLQENYEKLLQEETKNEDDLEEYLAEILALKQDLYFSQNEANDLRIELNKAQTALAGDKELANDAVSTQAEIKQLKEQVENWQTIYFESMEQGSGRIDELERQVNELEIERQEEAQDAVEKLEDIQEKYNTQTRTNTEMLRKVEMELEIAKSAIKEKDTRISKEQAKASEEIANLQDQLKQEQAQADQELSSLRIQLKEAQHEQTQNRLEEESRGLNSQEAREALGSVGRSIPDENVRSLEGRLERTEHALEVLQSQYTQDQAKARSREKELQEELDRQHQTAEMAARIHNASKSRLETITTQLEEAQKQARNQQQASQKRQLDFADKVQELESQLAEANKNFQHAQGELATQQQVVLLLKQEKAGSEQQSADNTADAKESQALESASSFKEDEIAVAKHRLADTERKLRALQDDSTKNEVTWNDEKSQLQSQMKELSTQINTISAERDMLLKAQEEVHRGLPGKEDSKLVDLQTQLNEEAKKTFEAEAKIQALQMDLNDARAQLAKEARSVPLDESELTYAKKKISQLETRLVKLEREKADALAKAKATDVSGALHTLEKEKKQEGAAAESTADMNDPEELDAKVKLLEKELNHAKEEIVLLSKVRMKLEKESLSGSKSDEIQVELEAKIASLEDERAKALAEASLAKESLEAATKDHQASNTALERRIESLQKEIERSEQGGDGLDALRGKIEEQAVYIEELQMEVEEAKIASAMDAVSSRDAMIVANQTDKTVTKELEAKVESLQKQLDSAKNSSYDLEISLIKMEEEQTQNVEEAHQQVEAMQKELEEIKRERALPGSVEHSALNERVIELEATVAKLEEEKGKALSAAAAASNELKSEEVISEQSPSAFEAQITLLQEDLKSTKAGAKEELSAIQARLDAEAQKSAEAAKTIEKLQKELEGSAAEKSAGGQATRTLLAVSAADDIQDSQKLSELEASLMGLESEKEAALTAANEANANFYNMKEENERLVQEQVALETSKQELESKLQLAEEELNNASPELSKLRDELKGEQDRVAEAEKRIDSLTKDLDAALANASPEREASQVAASAAAGGTENQVAELEGKIEDLEREMKYALASAVDATEKAKVLQQENEKLSASESELQDIKRELEAKLDEAAGEAANENFEKANPEQSSNQNEELEEERKKTAEAVALANTLKEENDKLSALQSELTEANKELESKLLEVNKEVDEDDPLQSVNHSEELEEERKKAAVAEALVVTLKARVADLETKSAELEKEKELVLQAMQTQVEEFRSVVDLKKKETESLQSKVKTSELSRDFIEGVENKFRSMEAEKQQMLADTKAMQRAMDELQEELETASVGVLQLEETKNRMAELEATIVNLENDKESALLEAMAKIEEFKEMVVNQKKEALSLQSKVKTTQISQAFIVGVEEKFKQMEAEKVQARVDNEAMQKAMDELQNELDNASVGVSELEETKKRIAELENTIAEMENDKESALVAAVAKIDELSSLAVIQKKEAMSLQDKVKANKLSQEFISGVERKFTEMEAEKQKMTAESVEMQKAMDELQTELETASVGVLELEDTRKKISHMEAKIAQLEGDKESALNVAKAQIDEFKLVVDVKEHEVATLQNKVQASQLSREFITGVEQKFKTMETEKQKVLAESKPMQTAMDELQTELEVASVGVEELERTRRKIQALESTVVELEKDKTTALLSARSKIDEFKDLVRAQKKEAVTLQDRLQVSKVSKEFIAAVEAQIRKSDDEKRRALAESQTFRAEVRELRAKLELLEGPGETGPAASPDLLQAKLDSMRRERDGFGKECKILEAKLDEANASMERDGLRRREELRQLKQSMSKAVTEKNTADEERTRLEGLLKDALDMIEEKNREVGKLKGELVAETSRAKNALVTGGPDGHNKVMGGGHLQRSFSHDDEVSTLGSGVGSDYVIGGIKKEKRGAAATAAKENPWSKFSTMVSDIEAEAQAEDYLEHLPEPLPEADKGGTSEEFSFDLTDKED